MSAVLAEAHPLIRPMRAADIEQVVDIEQRAYEFPWTVGIFSDCLAAHYSCWVMTDAHDRILGYGILSTGAGEAHLLNLCIADSHRGAGCGKRLLLRLIDVARWHRVDKMFLEVRPSNYAAVELYRRVGFRVVGRRPNYYPDHEGREDALIMSFTLRTAAEDD